MNVSVTVTLVQVKKKKKILEGYFYSASGAQSCAVNDAHGQETHVHMKSFADIC